MATLKEKFSTRLRMVRAEKGLSQENLADMLGMSLNGYARIERGETEVSLAKVEEISDKLQIEVSDLLPIRTSDTYFNYGRDQGTFYQANEQLVEKLMERVLALEKEIWELKLHKDISGKMDS